MFARSRRRPFVVFVQRLVNTRADGECQVQVFHQATAIFEWTAERAVGCIAVHEGLAEITRDLVVRDAARSRISHMVPDNADMRMDARGPPRRRNHDALREKNGE
jgi:hypothetical protein